MPLSLPEIRIVKGRIRKERITRIKRPGVSGLWKRMVTPKMREKAKLIRNLIARRRVSLSPFLTR